MTDNFHAPVLTEFDLTPVFTQIAVVGGGLAVVAVVVAAVILRVRRTRG